MTKPKKLILTPAPMPEPPGSEGTYLPAPMPKPPSSEGTYWHRSEEHWPTATKKKKTKRKAKKTTTYNY